MSWSKICAKFADQRWTLTDAAYRLHHEGLTWSNRKQTDGRLAKDDMRRWAKRPEAAEELVAVGWWEDHLTHYQIIQHIGYPRTKAQIANQSIRQLSREPQPRVGRRSLPKTSRLTIRNAIRITIRNATRTGRTGQ